MGDSKITKGAQDVEKGYKENGVPVSSNRVTYTEFSHQPKFSAADGYSDPVGTDATANIMVVDGETFEYQNIGTQTILAPVWGATGLNVARDLTADDGTEITQGVTARNKSAVTVGTDKAYCELELTLTDVSGTDDCLFGFRKVEAYQAAVDDYDEMAAFNIVSGDIKTETILNNGTTTTTDTTDDWADGETKVLRLEIDGAGRVTYKVDGAEPTVVAAFTFDTGEVVMPFFYMIHDTDASESTLFTKWSSGIL